MAAIACGLDKRCGGERVVMFESLILEVVCLMCGY